MPAGPDRGRGTALSSLSVLALCSAAAGQTDESLLLKPFDDAKMLEAEASLIWIPRSTPGGSTGRSNTLEAFSSGRLRLSTEHELNPTIGYDFTRLQIRDRAGRVPNVLSDESIAFATPLGQMGDWFVAIGGGVGYAGDEAFGNADAWYGKGQFTVGRELNKDEALVFWLDYDGNRTFFPDIPLPSVAYTRKLGERADMLIGFPISDVTWRPTDRFAIDISWEAPITFAAEGRFKITPDLSLLASYASDEHAFHEESLRSVDRLFYAEQRIEGGVSWSPGPGASILLAGGLAFARSLSTGFDDRMQETLAQVPDRPYLRAQIEIRF